ncbi:arylesterase [soil metagenome]
MKQAHAEFTAKTAYGVRARLVHGALCFFMLVGAAMGGGPAFAADKLVLAFGDSLTAGYGLAAREAFPVRLEGALRKTGLAARVYNAGVSGDTSSAARARLGWVLAGLKAKPDLAIVELGANDMLRGLKPAETRANMDAIMAELRKRGIPVLIAGMRAAPNMGKAYAGAFEPIFPQLAKTYGARLYPFFLNGVAANRALLQPDGLHPNPRGVDVVVRGILPQVRMMLR